MCLRAPTLNLHTCTHTLVFINVPCDLTHLDTWLKEKKNKNLRRFSPKHTGTTVKGQKETTYHTEKKSDHGP